MGSACSDTGVIARGGAEPTGPRGRTITTRPLSDTLPQCTPASESSRRTSWTSISMACVWSRTSAITSSLWMSAAGPVIVAMSVRRTCRAPTGSRTLRFSSMVSPAAACATTATPSATPVQTAHPTRCRFSHRVRGFRYAFVNTFLSLFANR